LEIKSKRARLNQNKKVEVIQPYVLVPQAFSTESIVFGPLNATCGQVFRGHSFGTENSALGWRSACVYLSRSFRKSVFSGLSDSICGEFAFWRRFFV
jgi:hypothetical protein